MTDLNKKAKSIVDQATNGEKDFPSTVFTAYVKSFLSRFLNFIRSLN